MAGRPDVEMVRETLERALGPRQATAVLYQAIERWGHGVPSTQAELLELVEGPLQVALEAQVGAARAEGLAASLAERLAPDEDEVELDIDVSDMGADGNVTIEIAKVPHAVSVLVVGRDRGFAARLLAALGHERVYANTIAEEAALRHAIFSATPQIVVVDGTRPPPIGEPAMVAAVQQLPDAVQSVVWASDSAYGSAVSERLHRAGIATVSLDRAEGIEPLLDLILSRFKSATIPPPP